MKKSVLFILIGIISLTIGYFIGKEIGFQEGEEKTFTQFHNRSIDEIKDELKYKEGQEISKYLKCSATIQTVDEGNFLLTYNVQYFTGTLTNLASVAVIKDVKININFFSKTGTQIGSKEITIFEYIRPGQTINFKEKINLPEKAENFDSRIIDTKYE